jgi:2-methylcitrate dehydratase PrpD
MSRSADLTGQLAAFIAHPNGRLPENVRIAAQHRILDALAAMLSGATLKPGWLANAYGESVGGRAEAQIMTTPTLTSVTNAALVNGMLAHADETDDFEPITKAHPGCAVVPAAWAMAERENASGKALIAAVVAGYDTCVRVLRAMDPDGLRKSHRSVEGIGATFGASAAAAAIARLTERPVRHVLSYAAQQASGVWSWVRDREHVEKAFDFGGMGARNGVYAATMVQAGFTGVDQVFEGEHNVLDAFSASPRPLELVEGLGERFFVAETAIKTYSVGYPMQSALDALFQLLRKHDFRTADVAQLVARLPEDGAAVVNGRAMPDVNIQHMLAVALLDRRVTFESSHDEERMHDPAVLEVKKRIRLQGERSMVDPAARRQAAIEVTLEDGRVLTHHTRHAPGTMENPLDADGVNAKARDLMQDVIGPRNTDDLLERVRNLEAVGSIRDLRPLLQRPSTHPSNPRRK